MKNKSTIPAVTKQVEKQHSPSFVFPIVGVGASAGGLEAFEQFFSNMPDECNMAFVVIQHLDPKYKGILPELIQRSTSMKVIQATNHLMVECNHVYVIPPNKCMTIANGYLFLFEPVESHGLRLPIDYFFRSLAEDQQERSVGVILSGMGSDGSLGLKAIKEKNGIIVVQDPANAKFDGMPKSAVDSVAVDILDAADIIPHRLMSLLKVSTAKRQKIEVDDVSKTNLEKIIYLLRVQTGHDFSLYKKNTLFRRIERRMNAHQIDHISDYVYYLKENPKEADILFKELLIGVTNFFRDSNVWEELRDRIFPELFKELPDGQVLRAWVTGCSTGEEAYSLAMVFMEAYNKVKLLKNFSLQIFATDIDGDAIDVARKGFYSSNIVSDVSPERISHFFVKEDSGYRVSTVIREMVVFAQHNIIKDPPFTKLSFLSCRNLLIYMEPELQKKMMNLFHYSLHPSGILVLGSAENDNSQNNQFSPIDAKLKIFRRSVISSTNVMVDFPSSFTYSKTHSSKLVKPMKIAENIQILTEQLMLQRFSPSSVLISSEGEILYITGRTGKYLEPAAGKANLNILTMAREGLRFALPGAIRKAKQSFEVVMLHHLKIGTNDGPQLVDVSLQLIDSPEVLKGTIIIVFSEVPTLSKLANLPYAQTALTNKEQELELELQRVNEELQSTREEMQSTQEELKSSNEEMQSTNEELQSTNEELTTSKEEMQSINEELQSVNIELQTKILDFTVANNDMKNLLNSTEIATLFLDKNLNIRRFTDTITNLFKLRATDIGRPFTDMVTDLLYPEITDHAKEVLRTLVYKESEIATFDHRWFLVRIMPYRTLEDHIDGLVITFLDITKSKQLEDELNKTIALLREHNLY